MFSEIPHFLKAEITCLHSICLGYTEQGRLFRKLWMLYMSSTTSGTTQTMTDVFVFENSRF